MPTPLIIGETEKISLGFLREDGHRNVVDVRIVLRLCATAKGKRKHMDQMNRQTVELPFGFMVTFSVEDGHPAGRCLHMSMSSPVAERVPTPEAVWMVAHELGFRGGIEACKVWEEELQRGPARHVAINVVQPIPS